MKKYKILYNIICLLGFHQWQKHIEWDNTLICVRCMKTKRIRKYQNNK